ncbi:MAG TPA: plastocyanin/azurin family copper-binding protein [Egicoccus sp.]|nr:plastocyanin/azurin family copper-binding protein [Egicoccus sp.]HSK22983.1 plastocyanin/azurin family copper-binding protein [Egicoccus sp.]
MPRPPVRLLLCAVVALVLAGCSGGGEATEPTSVGTPDETGVLRVTGTDTLRWDPAALEAPAGEITFELTCEERVNHNLVVEVDGERTMVAECGPGDTAEGTLDLDPGEYPFVCTIPGHEASMRGTLTVD